MNLFKKIFSSGGSKNENNPEDTNNAFLLGNDVNLSHLKEGDIIKIDDIVGRTPVNESFLIGWISAEDNPFGIPVFDCREYALKMISGTKDPKILEHYQSSRRSEGYEYVGKFPKNATKCQADVEYDLGGKRLPDGIVFKSQCLEEKWDIYKHMGFLIFVRSWTGEVCYMTDFHATENGFRITTAVVDEEKIENGDISHQMHILEFLIYTYIAGKPLPHPIPQSIQKDDYESILSYSFSLFGSHGLFATYY